MITLRYQQENVSLKNQRLALVDGELVSRWNNLIMKR